MTTPTYDPIAAMTSILAAQVEKALEAHAAGDLRNYASRLITIERVAGTIYQLLNSQHQPQETKPQ